MVKSQGGLSSFLFFLYSVPQRVLPQSEKTDSMWMFMISQLVVSWKTIKHVDESSCTWGHILILKCLQSQFWCHIHWYQKYYQQRKANSDQYISALGPLLIASILHTAKCDLIKHCSNWIWLGNTLCCCFFETIAAYVLLLLLTDKTAHAGR